LDPNLKLDILSIVREFTNLDSVAYVLSVIKLLKQSVFKCFALLWDCSSLQITNILFSNELLKRPMILLILFSLAIEYLPNNLDITSVKNLFLPVPCSLMMINAV
jgi:hypothetical protein